MTPSDDVKKGENLFDLILDSMAYLSGILLMAMMVIVSFAAVWRYLGYRPPVWVLQWTEYALLWIPLLGAGWLLRERGHIRIDTLITRLSPDKRRKAELIDHLLGFIVCILVFWFGTLHTVDLFQRGSWEVKGTTVVKYPIFLIIPVGALTLSIQFVRDFFREMKSKSEDKR